ncbi:MAG: C-GCAxxG-C-C family protein [Eubacterium sp.]
MDRGETAKQYFLSGYNCAQAVALAYADKLNMEPELIAKSVSGYGGGMGRMREVCGSISGAVFVISNLYGYSNPNAFDEKKALYQDVQSVCKAFQEENGSIICRELLSMPNIGADAPTPERRSEKYYQKRPCADIVKCSAQILEEFIKQKETE